MDDLHLVDFVELQVKSKEDFDTAHDIALSAGLGDIIKKKRSLFFSLVIGHVNFTAAK